MLVMNIGFASAIQFGWLFSGSYGHSMLNIGNINNYIQKDTKEIQKRIQKTPKKMQEAQKKMQEAQKKMQKAQKKTQEKGKTVGKDIWIIGKGIEDLIKHTKKLKDLGDDPNKEKDLKQELKNKLINLTGNVFDNI
jgi:DNA anti-recombination protein RmuC